MWGINYEDINKFHISIGLGLLVGAFILSFSSELNYYDRLHEYSNNINNTNDFEKELLGIKIEAMNSILVNNLKFSKKLFIIGMAFFTIGYIPFLIKNIVFAK